MRIISLVFLFFDNITLVFFSANSAIVAYCLMCARQTCKAIAKSNIASVKKSQPLEFGCILTIKLSKTNYLIQKKEPITRLLQGGESAGARTRDPNIKSVVAPRPYKSFAYGSTFKGNLLSYGFLSQPHFTQLPSCVSAILTCGLHSGLHQHYF